MQETTGKYRVSDRALDDAVHQLALMCVERGIRRVDALPHEIPLVVADIYCEASEAIRKRINEQRLTDASHPEGWWEENDRKVWFDTDASEIVFHGDVRTRI